MLSKLIVDSIANMIISKNHWNERGAFNYRSKLLLLVEFPVDVPINAIGILMENVAFAPGFVLFLRIL